MAKKNTPAPAPATSNKKVKCSACGAPKKEADLKDGLCPACQMDAENDTVVETETTETTTKSVKMRSATSKRWTSVELIKANPKLSNDDLAKIAHDQHGQGIAYWRAHITATRSWMKKNNLGDFTLPKTVKAKPQKDEVEEA